MAAKSVEGNPTNYPPPSNAVPYAEHSLGAGAEAQAVAYIQIETDGGATYFGAGIDTSIELASIKAVVSAVNRSVQANE